MFIKRTTSRKKRVNWLTWFIAFLSSLNGVEVHLREIDTQSTCHGQYDQEVALKYLIEPPDTTLFYVKCYYLLHSSDAERWVHAYTFGFSNDPSNNEIYKVSERYSHIWDRQNGTFALFVEKPEARWYHCDFEGAGKHRHIRSYTEILPIHSDGATISNLFPNEKVFQFQQKWRDRHLHGTVGGSGCFPEGADHVELTWMIIPRDALVFSVKCYQTSNPRNAEKRHIFTYEFETGTQVQTHYARSVGLDFHWKKSLGQLSISISRPLDQDGMWYFCDFNGAGRHRHRRAFIQLKPEPSANYGVHITSPTSLLEEQTSAAVKQEDFRILHTEAEEGESGTSPCLLRSEVPKIISLATITIMFLLIENIEIIFADLCN